MRVLFICGTGQILRAVDAIEKRLKGSVELDRLEKLDDLDDYFSKGHQFDKCVVLSPDRLIPNYSHELLYGKMDEFKRTINSRCSNRVDILLCVVSDTDGYSLAEQFSDMSGMVTIIQVEEKLAITKMIDFIVQQGSTLAQRYKHYDLTSVLKNVAKETLENQPNNVTYKSLDELADELEEDVKEESYITGIHLDNTDEISQESTDDIDIPEFNMDGFTDFGSLGSEDDFDIDRDNMFDDVKSEESDFDFSITDVDDSPKITKEVSQDDIFDMFSLDTDMNVSKEVDDLSDFGKESTESEPIMNTEDKQLKKPSLKKKTKSNNSEDEKVDIGKKPVEVNKSPFKSPLGIKKVAKEDESTEKKTVAVDEKKDTVKKKKGLFSKKDTSDIDYELDEKKKNKSSLKKPVVIPKDNKEVETVEVSEAKTVGLKTIKKAPFKKTPIKSAENNDMNTVQQEVSDSIINDEANFEINPQGTLAAEELFELDTETSRMIEKGSGTGLHSDEVTGRGHKKRTKADKELAELLKPYMKHGGLLVVTGSHGTGKTVVSSNLAHLLCKYGYRVCILDFDFKGKGQSYINLDTFRTVHGGYQMKMNSVNVANSTGSDFAKWTDVVKEGYHVITTTLNSDVDETGKLIHNENMGGLIRLLTKVYTFVIVDVEFQDLVTYYKDFANYADALISVEETSQHGITNFMLNMINIEDDEIENTMFNKLSLVLNKEDGMKSFFGRKISSTNDLLVALDDTVTALAQESINYSFTEIPVISILKYSNVYEKFWYTNKYISDTQDGEKLFADLLQNALTN